MKILITGASGLLGSNLALAALDVGHEVFTTSHRRPLSDPRANWRPTNLVALAEVRQLVKSTTPEWIINCAAATDVDRCERDPEWATSLNHDAARHLALEARRHGSGMIHISTDAVFDGESELYRVDDEPKPINIYGASKFAGEQAVLDISENALIVRTNFYGWSPTGRTSLAEWFLARLQANQTCLGFTDVWFCPLLVNQLAEFLLQLTEGELAGRYHIVARDSLTKAQFGERVASAFGLDPDLIVPTSVAAADLHAPRSRNLILDSSKIERDLGVTMPTVDEGISLFKLLGQNGQRDRLRELVPYPVQEGIQE